MGKPSALIVSGYGINCEMETAHAFELAGGKTKVVHVNDLIENKSMLKEFEILVFPGGFSYGDHSGAGKAFANKLRGNFLDGILSFFQRDTLGIGICNGFQTISNLGLVPDTAEKMVPECALIPNKSSKYQCQWEEIQPVSQKCIWTKNLKAFDCPMAHGEGQFFAEESVIQKLKEKDQIAFTYTNNPNGSAHNIAGICNPSGKILGLMPHPERALFFTNHPQWTALAYNLKKTGKTVPEFGEGLKIYQNGVNYFS